MWTSKHQANTENTYKTPEDVFGCVEEDTGLRRSFGVGRLRRADEQYSPPGRGRDQRGRYTAEGDDEHAGGGETGGSQGPRAEDRAGGAGEGEPADGDQDAELRQRHGADEEGAEDLPGGGGGHGRHARAAERHCETGGPQRHAEHGGEGAGGEVLPGEGGQGEGAEPGGSGGEGAGQVQARLRAVRGGHTRVWQADSELPGREVLEDGRRAGPVQGEDQPEE